MIDKAKIAWAWVWNSKWQIVLAIALTMIVGFNWGGWVTGGTYRKDVAAAKVEGGVQAMVPGCVAAAFADRTKVDALMKESTWSRSNVIEKEKWAPNSDVARACADAIAEQHAKKS